MNDNLKFKINNIPDKPGCYLWKNKFNEIIYVGKAKNLNKRVKQYLVNIIHPKKIALMNEVYDIDYLITNNENESLLLESNLIKKYLPKYNILLKDESEYPYIILTNEIHPRLLYSRKINKIDGKYYGPLADPNFNRFSIYKILNQLVPFRKCNKIPNKKCLYYDIGQCLGPCINNINPSEYQKWKDLVNDLFHNKTKKIRDLIKEKELNAAELLNFESAKEYKDISDSLQILENKQIVQMANNELADYIAYYYDNNWMSILIFKYVDNKLLSKFNMIEEVIEDEFSTLYNLIKNYYHVNSVPTKIVMASPEYILEDLNIIYNNKFKQPNNNELKIIANALENAKDFYKQNLYNYQVKNDLLQNNINELKQIIGLNTLNRFEVIDISNIQLTNSVCFVNVYINGIYSSKLSRPYILKSIENKSDYEYMKEIITRRYSSINDQVDLIILDGGKIQIKAAIESFKAINKTYNLIGLQKNDKHQTDAIVLSDFTTIPLNKSSNLYMYLVSIQDKVHNNAINFFRKQKIKNDLVSILESIKGLGKTRINKLYKFYNDINEIKKASVEQLSQIVPTDIAIKIYKFFND